MERVMLYAVILFCTIINCMCWTTLDEINHSTNIQNEILIDIVENDNEYRNGLLQQLVHYSSNIPFNTTNFTKTAEMLLNRTKRECKSLNLSSPQCYEDCVYYLDPLTLLTNISDTAKITQVLYWYSLGGSAIGYWETGNPDMCQYFHGTYCYTPIVGNDMILMEHGCCVPGTCVGSDALKVLHKNVYCYQGFNETYNQMMLKGQGTILHNCEPLQRNLSSFGFCFVIAIFGIFLLFVVVASIITQLFETKSMNKKPQTIFESYLYCFSIQKTWNYFVRRRPLEQSQFNFLDGIRVGSMTWVIYGHAWLCYLAYSGLSNLATILPMGSQSYDYVGNKWYAMLSEYGPYSVDSFFYLSGLLGAFSIVRQVNKYGRDKALRLCYLWIPMAYLARFLRIVPIMMFVTAIQWKVSDQLPYGYHVMDRSTYSDVCTAEWYKILFFYDNLKQEMDCMGHLWYIQCDMQCFLILPFLVLLFEWKKSAGLLSTLIPIIVSIMKRVQLAIEYQFAANMYQPSHPPKGSINISYVMPVPRASVYFIGVFTMFLILTLQQNKFQKIHISEIIYCVLMCLSGFILLSLVFWPYSDVKNGPQNRWSVHANQWYYVLGKPVWGIGLGLMSIAFVFRNSKHKSIIKTILASEIWQPIGKLTFSMYLIHYPLGFWWAGDISTPQYYSFWNVFFLFSGGGVIAFFMALILWFVIEQPMANIVGLFMKWLSNVGRTMKPPNPPINAAEKKEKLGQFLLSDPQPKNEMTK